MNIRIKNTLAIVPLIAALAGCGDGTNDVKSAAQNAVPPISLEAALPGADSAEIRSRKYKAHRFLEATTFGPTLRDLNHVAEIGYGAWIDEQMAMPPTLLLPQIQQVSNPRWSEYVNLWWINAVKADDQLRQRVAFALSEIFVISAQDGLGEEQAGLANYYDILVRNAFGNYRDLIEEITLSPIMGEYLSMKGNHKPDASRNIRPDENYARELLQLFSVGLEHLNQDGSPILNDNGIPRPTFSQDIVEGFAHVFTGWHFANADNFIWSQATDYISPMRAYPNYHDNGPKSLLRGFTLEGGKTPEQDLKIALDNIFYHPNVGPFLSKQLIQRLVTSNPSPQYISDVAAVFNEDANGNRGSLASVIRAILMHNEARHGHEQSPNTFGKLKEPVIRITSLWRAFEPLFIAPNFSYSWVGNEIGQAPLNAPSVFNFFTPGFSQPGGIRNNGLVSPEFQIHDESSIIKLTSRLLASSIWSHNYAYDADGNRMLLNIDLEVALEEHGTDSLLDHLDLVLLGGEMSETLRNEARQLMSSFRNESQGPQRVIEAIFLIVSAPESAVQI